MRTVVFAALRAVWFCVAAGLSSAWAQSPQPVPLEAFFKPAAMRSAALSPSGRWLAALQKEGQQPRVGISIIDLEGKEGTRFIQANEKDDVVWFQWVSDDWLVFRVDDPNDRSVWGMGSGLMTTKRDGSVSRMLVSREWGTADMVGRRALEPNHVFLGLGAPGSNEVVIEEYHYDNSWRVSHTTLKLLNVATSGVRGMLEGAPRASDWWLDAKGRARVAAHYVNREVILHWADAAGAWRELGRFDIFTWTFWPVYVEGDDALVVSTRDAKGHLELRRFDFKTMRPGNEVLLATPGFDSDLWPRYDRASGRLLGVHLTVDSATTHWFDPTMRSLQARADARFQGRVNLLYCAPCDKPASVLVYSYADNDPGMTLLYRPAEDKWQLVGRARPDIDPARMSELEMFRTKARDGLELPVWITRPRPAPGAAAAKPAPAVVLVHGGPHSRGTEWRWNREAQFLASRGYVVIEPEFRGSDGYGIAHMRAGFRQWGLAMQDDVTDALRFAVDKGWADASRVCIVGASYGGYAALMGLVKDPDQYRCGVAHVAVTDPRFVFDFHWSDESPRAKVYGLPVTLGDRKADDAKFAATSPLEQAARIKAPILLVHGALDRRVPIQNGERMRDALVKHGKVHEWVVYPDEGHGLYRDENRFDYFRRVEAFLAKHLKP